MLRKYDSPGGNDDVADKMTLSGRLSHKKSSQTTHRVEMKSQMRNQNHANHPMVINHNNTNSCSAL